VSRKAEGFCNLAGDRYTAAMKSALYSGLVLLALTVGLAAQTLPGGKKTAFALVKEGDKVIDPQARDKVMQIRSDKSVDGLMPDVWYVAYFDPTAAFKTTEVTFVNGKVTEIKRPKHLLDAFSGSRQMEWKRVKIDSDRALAIALKESLLKKADLRATQFWLERSVTDATWQIRFWGVRPDNADKTYVIGDIYIAGKSGQVVKTNLHVKGD
jgi:hypothetical protein